MPGSTPRVDAREAERIGLVDRVVLQGEFIPAAKAISRKIPVRALWRCASPRR
jgi:enoyl-CoA hydratase/carnithine racemase